MMTPPQKIVQRFDITIIVLLSVVVAILIKIYINETSHNLLFH